MKQKVILLLVRYVAPLILRCYFCTMRIEEKNSLVRDENEQTSRGAIFALWHENIMAPIYVNRNQGFEILVSKHFDGEIVASILNSFGYKTARGSSSRGGAKAYLALRDELCKGENKIAITPDGPRGPRRKVKAGVLHIAGRTGRPIIPVGVATSHSKRLRSWDKFLLLVPFSKVIVAYGTPVEVPAELCGEGLDRMKGELQTVLNDLDKTAATWL
ncbi:MAG: lysophospholipid acyltransferase family protein [Calditrichia bacterium]